MSHDEETVRLVVYVPRRLHKLLKVAVAAQGTSMSAWFRERIEAYIVRKETKECTR